MTQELRNSLESVIIHYKSLGLDNVYRPIISILGEKDIEGYYVSPFLHDSYLFKGELEGDFNVLVGTSDGIFIDFVFKENYFRYDILMLSSIYRMYIKQYEEDDKVKFIEAYFFHDVATVKPTVVTARVGVGQEEVELRKFINIIKMKCFNF